jgi:hypothetical protein
MMNHCQGHEHLLVKWPMWYVLMRYLLGQSTTTVLPIDGAANSVDNKISTQFRSLTQTRTAYLTCQIWRYKGSCPPKNQYQRPMKPLKIYLHRLNSSLVHNQHAQITFCLYHVTKRMKINTTSTILLVYHIINNKKAQSYLTVMSGMPISNFLIK